ncbi:MAG TPA: proton-conducting transporter membrane subunit [Bacteroidia bacterium]|nr:proton-conducting transporter membrane subunit [Bacteroidia bacterium]HRS59942.1 proton-conducting transporter membrane subunit [Bacteroidia bacterium]HRU68709.1 proton-conducting transporter membrane subunit [Bacteroidia bacterium]
MALLSFFILSAIMSISIVIIKNRILTKILTIGFAIIHLSFVAYCWINLNKTELDYFTYDSLGLLFLSILSVISIPAIYHSFIYLKNEDIRKFTIYNAAFIALITFMSGAYLANGMAVIWIFVEATTLAVAALIYHDRTELALEATWKYIFVCSIGIALAYIGILFLSMTMHGTGISDLSFSSMTRMISNANPLYLKIAFVFIFVGFSTKMGLFPMHTITIDAHSVSPPPISALISTALMNVGFLAIFRAYLFLSSSVILPFMRQAFIIAGLLSLLISAGYMLKAKHLKRMLAYSSLENMGLVAIGVGVGGIGYYAAVLVILLHTLTKSSLFFQMGQLSRVLKTFKLDECGNYMKLYPAGALVLITGMLCILAIPPSGLFISEFILLKAMVLNGQWFVFIVTVLLLCCVIYAMSTRIMHITFSDSRNPDQCRVPGNVNPVETISQFIFLGLVIILCFYQPPILVDLINQSISVLPK